MGDRFPQAANDESANEDHRDVGEWRVLEQQIDLVGEDLGVGCHGRARYWISHGSGRALCSGYGFGVDVSSPGNVPMFNGGLGP